MFTFSLNVTTKSGRELIPSFSFAVNDGDKIALIGEEGNGKSLFLKTLMNDSTLDDLIVHRQLSKESLIFGYVSQEIQPSALQETMMDYVIRDQWDYYSEFLIAAQKLLPHISDEDYGRTLDSFSGGERVKIQMMRLLLESVDVYIFDEPTNNMDIETIEWFENWVQSLTQPVLFVSHDQHLLRSLSNRTLHFEQLNRKTKSVLTLYEGGYEAYLEHHGRSIEKHNTDVMNTRREKEKQEEKWQKQYNRVSHQLQHVARQDPGLQKKMKNLKAQKRRYDRDETQEVRSVESQISMNYDFESKPERHLFSFHCDTLQYEGRVLAENLKLSMSSHQQIACIGENGVGKSSFVKALIKDLDKQKLKVAVMHQDYRHTVDLKLSPIENCVVHGDKAEREAIGSQLGNLRFTSDEMMMPLERLSGGQKVKVAFLKLIRQNPDILILDEPTRNLSPNSVVEIAELLQGYPNAMFCISHDRDFIEAVFEDVLKLTSQGLITTTI